MTRRLLLLLPLAFVSACLLSEVDLREKACPCVVGYECDTRRDRCVPEGTIVDVPDSGVRDAVVPIEDSGFDSGLVGLDARPDAAEGDTGVVADGGPADADGGVIVADAGPDGGIGDTGPPPCLRDSHCGPAPQSICVAGQCVPGCNQPGATACTSPLTCDPVSGHCFQFGIACTVSSQCGSGPPVGACVGGRCKFGCAVSTDQCEGNRMCLADGFCHVPLPCAQDGDCGDRDFICTSGSCQRRCDLPGASLCLGTSSCNTTSGRCEGGLLLGADCTANQQCASQTCLMLVSPTMVSFCSTPCGATSDCPLDFTCQRVSGTPMCIRENAFSPPAQLDTPSGDACSNPSNICQSQICTTNLCTERCSKRGHCDHFGDNCRMFVVSGRAGTVVTQQCLPSAAAGEVGSGCPDEDSVCKTGICNRYANACAAPCCADSDCPPNQNCTVYDVTATEPITICQPRSGGTGNLLIGQSCLNSASCDTEVCTPVDPANLPGPKICSTHCCTDHDCDVIPGGGRCAVFPGPLAQSGQKLCIPR